MKRQWYVCEAPEWRTNGGFCLYTDKGAERMEARRGLARCIKHGALLGYDPGLDGLSRQEARKRVTKEFEDAR